MDPLVRRRRSLLILSLPGAALVVACAGGSGSLGAVGESNKTARGLSGRDAGADAFVDGARSLPANYQSTFTKVNKARLVSQGHAAGRWDVDVWANEPAVKALASRARAVPPGAVIVQEHHERGDARQKGPIMVMEKRPPGFSKDHGDWRFAVVGSQGQLVKDGAIEACAGCHDEAPMDGLFPIVE